MKGYYKGTVSSVNSDTGQVRVTYPVHNNMVSPWLPLLANEYNMPNIGDIVGTIIGEDGDGVCIGVLYTVTQTPPAKQGFLKQIEKTKIIATESNFELQFEGGYIKYNNGTLHISAPSVVIDNYNGECTC